ncbi:acyltransferase family protein [Candidatus Contendibacter odensensis]|uniref:Acyltransferase 3 n=1 Tax=Candidatus Contendobacter odensis Run_B_J11 TaxID=1400861 RepID=A0A7U7J289_9GAMM|nr:acyltransferase [Candidatus Contendobacter odensis]CDH43053.1 putative Acyltransferase 3 [Candidatus Contendobacter odensis Run_B_J11]
MTHDLTTTNAASIKKLAGIDAARGWAILLVIMVHTPGVMPELPYPLKKITSFGWYGVQLFFIASAFTLLNSWYRDARPVGIKTSHFFLRRFLRIAPMYYAGAILYYFLRPPSQGFDINQLLLSLSFINSWSPSWIPTTESGWSVVPGGWSISVEFCFYFVFPVLAFFAASTKRSLLLFTVSIFIMLLGYTIGNAYYMPLYGMQATEQFLYFWLPNQLCIFAIGFIIFSALNATHQRLDSFLHFLRYKAGLVNLFGIILLLALTQIGIIKHLSSSFPWIPTHLVVSIIFGFIVIANLMSPRPSPLLINPFICRLGAVSFSAYVLHWAVIDLVRRCGVVLNLSMISGWEAIGVFLLVVFPFVVILTYGLSKLTYQFVEQPFIRLSSYLIQSRLFQAAAVEKPHPVRQT